MTSYMMACSPLAALVTTVASAGRFLNPDATLFPLPRPLRRRLGSAVRQGVQGGQLCLCQRWLWQPICHGLQCTGASMQSRLNEPAIYLCSGRAMPIPRHVLGEHCPRDMEVRRCYALILHVREWVFRAPRCKQSPPCLELPEAVADSG